MPLDAEGLARRLHEERIGQEARRPAPPESPSFTPPLQKTTDDYNISECRAGSMPEVRVQPESGEIVVRSPATPRASQRVKPLTQTQQCAVELLILGHGDQSVAAELSIHRVTVTGWRLYHPAFRAELARRRQEVWGAAAEKFRGLLDKALSEIGSQLQDANPDVRFRAARAILSLGRRYEPPHEPSDVEGVLTLEARKRNVEYYELHPSKALVYEEDREKALKDLEHVAQEQFTISVELPARRDPAIAAGDESGTGRSSPIDSPARELRTADVARWTHGNEPRPSGSGLPGR
jgi:hypothetical protein